MKKKNEEVRGNKRLNVKEETKVNERIKMTTEENKNNDKTIKKRKNNCKI